MDSTSRKFPHHSLHDMDCLHKHDETRRNNNTTGKYFYSKMSLVKKSLAYYKVHFHSFRLKRLSKYIRMVLSVKNSLSFHSFSFKIFA